MEIPGGGVFQGRSRASTEALRQEVPVSLRHSKEASGLEPSAWG